MADNKLDILEVFENKYPGRDYLIVHESSEFTSVCPKTGQPDFATMILEYIPDKLCVELKSLKLYYQSYRNDGIFYETVTNKILDDLVQKTQPRWMKLTAKFNVRGGFGSTIYAEHQSESYKKNK